MCWLFLIEIFFSSSSFSYSTLQNNKTFKISNKFNILYKNKTKNNTRSFFLL